MSKKKQHKKQPQHGAAPAGRAAKLAQAAEEADPPSPAGAHIHAEQAALSAQPAAKTAAAAAGDTHAAAKKADKKRKSSLLRGLLGFLNKNAAHKASGGAAQAPTRWTPQEKLMLANIGELHAARVGDIMIPRAEIEALDLEETTLAEALRLFEETGRSRMPVYHKTLDDPRGMIHIRDILGYITRAILPEKADAEADIKAGLRLAQPIGRLGLLREILFVPDSMPAGRLLARMQASRIQIALVIDEHGGTDGLVSMEDIVELVVGDIEDEHDDESDDIVKEAQNSWVLDAATELEELKSHSGLDFADNALSAEVDTIGGLIVSALSRIPARGEKIQLELFPHYQFQILDADRRRVKRIRLTRQEPPQTA